MWGAGIEEKRGRPCADKWGGGGTHPEGVAEPVPRLVHHTNVLPVGVAVDGENCGGLLGVDGRLSGRPVDLRAQTWEELCRWSRGQEDSGWGDRQQGQHLKYTESAGASWGGREGAKSEGAWESFVEAMDITAHGMMLPSRLATQMSSPGNESHPYVDGGAGKRNLFRMLRKRVPRGGRRVRAKG